MALQDKVIKSVKWNAVATVYSIVINMLRLVVLTRLLEKSDFGLVAIATMIISFTEIFSDLGLTIALIHKQDITDNQYSSVFWLNIIISFTLYGVVCAFTPIIANAYSEKALLLIIPLLSIQILLNSFGKMFQTIKTKELEFAFLSKVKIVSMTIGLLLTIVLAYLRYGVFSMVWGQLLQVAINQLCYIIAGRKDTKITLHLNFREIGDILKIGVFQLGARVMDVVASKIDILLIGKFFGMEDLGIYNLAKELIQRPLQIIQQLVNNVATSAFAKIQDNYASVKDNFSFLLKIVTTISCPIYLCAIVFADPIIELLYSYRFIDSAFFLRVLSIYGMLTSIESLSSTLLASYGKTNISFYLTITTALLSLPIVLIASNYTLKVIAYGLVLIAFLNYFLRWKFAVNGTIYMRLSAYFKAISKPLLLSIIAAFPFGLLLNLWDFSVLESMILILLYVVLYVALYYSLDRFFVKNVLLMVLNRKS